MGRGFVAAVGGSILHAAGLPELIAADLARYEALALDLAQQPQRLGALRQKLIPQPKPHAAIQPGASFAGISKALTHDVELPSLGARRREASMFCR